MARLAAALAVVALAQQPGHLETEGPPTFALRDGGETRRLSAVLDANWRWLHAADGYQNCFSGAWDTTLCPDAEACARACALEAVSADKYAETYGVRAGGEGWDLELSYVTGGNVGSRLYAVGAESYEPFRLIDKELAFDVDLSGLPCGLNAAVYLVAADLKGDLGRGANAAGFRYGTGYADAQCPVDLKFVRGAANLDFSRGACATEIDLLEANSRATSFTLHPCRGDTCDRAGAGLNPYREGFRTFYGPGMVVDTSRRFRVATSFRAAGSRLASVAQAFEQEGRGPLAPTANWSITSESIASQAARFGERSDFEAAGGWDSLTDALQTGMVLVLSIWDDAATGMRWLDSTFPPGATGEGAARGPCDGEDPSTLRERAAGARVRLGNFSVTELPSSPRECCACSPDGDASAAA
jgi:cellulose 1,4-beta-cellobiosidase